MNQSVVFGILILNLLSCNGQNNLEKVLNSENLITTDKQESEKVVSNFIKVFWIVIFYGLSSVFIIIIFPSTIKFLIIFKIIFVLLLLLYIWYFRQIIYYSIIEKKDLRIIKLIINFQKKNNYPYSRNDFEQGRRVLTRLNNRLILLKTDRMKDQETILYLKKYFVQNTLVEIKSYFCYAQERYQRNIAVDAEFLASFFVSILFLYIISLNNDLQEKLEKDTYNALFGSSIFIFLGLPTMKWLLNRNTNHTIEIYSKCISLLERAIN